MREVPRDDLRTLLRGRALRRIAMLLRLLEPPPLLMVLRELVPLILRLVLFPRTAVFFALPFVMLRPLVILRAEELVRRLDARLPDDLLRADELFLDEVAGIMLIPLFLRYFQHFASRRERARPCNPVRGCPDR